MSIEWKVADKLLDLFKILFSKRKASDVLREAKIIRQIAENIVASDLSIDCFLLGMVHNGTGKLIPHGFKYWSLIDGDHNDFLMPRFRINAYQNVIMDLDYLNLFSNIQRYKEYDTRPEEMHAGAMRTNFEFEKVRFARWYFLKQNRNKMWFIVVGTVAQNETLSSTAHIHRLNVDINRVKNIIKKY